MAGAHVDEGYCLCCHYPLRGIDSARCPECGRAFDPADPWSMDVGRPMGPIVRKLVAADGPNPTVACVLLACVTLWSSSLPGGRRMLLPALMLWLLFFGVMLLREIPRKVLGRIYRAPAARASRLRFVSDPTAVFAVSTVVALLQLPFYVRFAVSLPWLEAHARHAYYVAPASNQESPAKLVGLYVVNTGARPNGVDLRMDGWGRLTYVPPGCVPPADYTTVHLWGRWYMWWEM